MVYLGTFVAINYGRRLQCCHGMNQQERSATSDKIYRETHLQGREMRAYRTCQDWSRPYFYGTIRCRKSLRQMPCDEKDMSLSNLFIHEEIYKQNCRGKIRKAEVDFKNGNFRGYKYLYQYKYQVPGTGTSIQALIVRFLSQYQYQLHHPYVTNHSIVEESD